MAYVRYQGQPNVYDTSSGKIVTYEQAQAQNLFAPGVIQDVNTPSPYASAPVTQQSFTGAKLTPFELSQINPPTSGPMTPLDLRNQPEFPLTPTPYETQASSLIQQTMDLNKQLLGKSAYQTEQDKKFGVVGLETTVNDLTAKLQGIANEAAAIPVQEQSRAAQGTVLTAGLQADQNQKIRDNAVQALGVSTLIAAAQGNLANAQALANRAVAAKYDPILEQIAVNKSNLDLILNDPLSTLAEKNRAQAQKEAQDKKADEVEAKKLDAKDIWDIATTAAQNGNNFRASGIYTTLAKTLTAISEAPTKEQALQIATNAGLVQAKATGSTTTTPNTKVPFAKAAQNLQNQRIPSVVLNSDGSLQLGYKRKLLDSGLSAEAIDWLWGEVAGGTSFEDIRAEMQANGVDTAVLDTFVQTLQAE